MVSLLCCGPKCSICCTLLSVWGIIMLAIMGVLLNIQSAAFAEDLLKDYDVNEEVEFFKHVDERYANASYSCWIAACIYGVTFVWSLWQAFLNKKYDKF